MDFSCSPTKYLLNLNPAIVSFLAGYQSKERLRLIDARPSIAQAHIMARPDKKLGFGIFGMTVLSNKNQEGLVAGVCCFSKLSTISVDEEKKSPLK